MIKKIINLLKQMSPTEKEAWYNKIKKDTYLKEKEGMLRDDIVKVVILALHDSFLHIKEEINENDRLQYKLDLDAVDITGFAETLQERFEIEEIVFADIMEWQTVKDIINTINNQLECALHDMEEN